MNARARNHSVVAEQWVCAWLRLQRSAFRRVSLRKIPKDSTMEASGGR